MFKFGVSNLRRLKQVTPIEIRPITLLLGRNSGGKSTFLRSFPLFRQSLMTRTSSPILWYGDLVDFGSYEISHTDGGGDGPISFYYAFDEITVEDRPSYYYGPNDELSVYAAHSRSTTYNDISYTISVSPYRERTRLSSIKVFVGSLNLTLSIEMDLKSNTYRLLVDEIDITHQLEPAKIVVGNGSLIPEIRIVSPKVEVTPNSPWWLPESTVLLAQVRRLVRNGLDRRIKDSTVNAVSSRLLGMGFPRKDEIRRIARRFGGQKVQEFFEDLTGDDKNKIYPELANLLVASAMPPLLRAISSKLRSILSSTLYIGPARARSERYYRYQDLAVSEIDPDGKNFPMFLNSLNPNQMGKLSAWIEGLFGYGVNVQRQTGHISITLTDGDHRTNIVDVGYGVSQILPVLGQIWWARERPPSRGTPVSLSLLAIEQPELHLHPAHQALLADALVGEAVPQEQQRSQNDHDSRTHYLVETHSETLVNRLGELIAAQRLSPDDVQVVIFEADGGGTRTTTVRTVQFDETGALIDWPFGFFQAPAY
jgi:hypothetical protein